MIQRLCKNCGNAFTQFNRLNTKCPLCVYNKQQKPRKPMRRMGKVTKQWLETRREWIAAHPSPTYTWLCYLCDRELTIDELTLDHIIARSRDPSKRYDWDNLAPCCYACNEAKGSLSLEQYALKLSNKSAIV